MLLFSTERSRNHTKTNIYNKSDDTLYKKLSINLQTEEHYYEERK